MPRPRTWTDDQLRRVLPEARSWKEVCANLAVPVGGKTLKALRDRAAVLGLDYGHLYGGGQRKPIESRISDDALRRLVPECRSWNHLALRVGYRGSHGRWQTRLADRVEQLGVSVEHFRGRGFNGLRPIQAPRAFKEAPSPERLRVAATGKAIAWFSERGHVVSLPVEPAAYDLIVDSPQGLDRVQVKSSTAKRKAVGFTRTVYDSSRPGTRSSGNFRQVPYEPGQIDYFFVVLADGSTYLIPYEVIGRRTSAVMGERYREFRV